MNIRNLTKNTTKHKKTETYQLKSRNLKKTGKTQKISQKKK